MAQAIRDIYDRSPKVRREAILWTKSPDFEAVCDMACIPASDLRQQMLALASMSHGLARKYGQLLRANIVDNIYD